MDYCIACKIMMLKDRCNFKCMKGVTASHYKECSEACLCQDQDHRSAIACLVMVHAMLHLGKLTLKLASVLTRCRFRAAPCRLLVTFPHPQSSSIATSRAYSERTMDKLDDAVEVMLLVKTAVQPGPNPTSAGSTSPGDHMNDSTTVIKRTRTPSPGKK
ncbi:hypothetical protein E2C01_044735 [Portunus trituberculatus]|uniref:Uncharacterized protein n=1 Tax=Portunus trituberculatus TaxID=210409 RepID=A0A5B7FTW3_PORTR|nr:hypothetical protein [Portunus trituberculatus]